ncbi:MAG: hypothetical protein JWL86_1908, partial [Rhizobium sp.]|nr:hypothetical protein [Rhizobium sp.]
MRIGKSLEKPLFCSIIIMELRD